MVMEPIRYGKVNRGGSESAMKSQRSFVRTELLELLTGLVIEKDAIIFQRKPIKDSLQIIKM